MSEKRKLTEVPVYQALILGVLALGAALLMGGGNLLTEGPIAERLKEDLLASLTQVIPPELHDNDLLAAAITVGDKTAYQAKKDGAVQAVAFSAEGKGYGGTITLIMGVDREGRILGVRVISHTETPGLGDKIEVLKAKWIEAFSGLTLGEPPEAKWAVKKDGGIFDQFSGATITPRAVVAAVKENLAFFLANKSLFLAEDTP